MIGSANLYYHIINNAIIKIIVTKTHGKIQASKQEKKA